MLTRNAIPAYVLLGLSACNGHVVDGTVTSSDASPDASTFVCTPPGDASQPQMTFTGTLFSATGGCLAGPPITLPVCGCFRGTGRDTSTWCFAAPDGTAYFATSDDQCDVEMPPGWYATQTFGPSPWGTPNAAQQAACAGVASASTVKATYDRLGPPACSASSSAAEAGPSSEGAAAPSYDADICIYPAKASTVADGSADGCTPGPTKEICEVSNGATVLPDGGVSGGTESCKPLCGASQYELTCVGGSAVSEPDPSLGCSILPLPTPADDLFYCCPCGS